MPINFEVELKAKEKEIQEKVMQCVAKVCGVNVSEVNIETRFVEDLGVSSLEFLDLIMAIEQDFDTEITDQEASKISSVKALIIYVMEKKAAR